MDFDHFSDVKNNGNDFWQYLVPGLQNDINHITKKQLDELNLFSIPAYIVKVAVYEALRGKKTNVPIDDILFFAAHGLLSNRSIVYMKNKL